MSDYPSLDMKFVSRFKAALLSVVMISANSFFKKIFAGVVRVVRNASWISPQRQPLSPFFLSRPQCRAITIFVLRCGVTRPAPLSGRTRPGTAFCAAAAWQP
jgi:hypothetical protein